MPYLTWPDPILYPAPVPLLPAPPIQVVEPRTPARLAQPVVRYGTTDIPESYVDNVIGRRRPNLAQRAQAARLEGAADRAFRAGHFAQAAERYQQAIAQASDNDEAKFKRGAALIASGYFGEAGRVIRDALRERPDWPYVPHDLHDLFPDDASIAQALERLERESRRPDADNDVMFLRGYVLYFTGQRAAAELIFSNPPEGGSTTHFGVFQEALDRQRGNR